jgi:hypothetical protein
MKYIILIIIGLFAGCATNKEQHLLYEESIEHNNYTYKSITIKDYTIKENS